MEMEAPFDGLLPRGIMRPMDKATADSRSLQSFATGHGNFVIGSFNTRAKNGLSV